MIGMNGKAKGKRQKAKGKSTGGGTFSFCLLPFAFSLLFFFS
jgi:hypothetical protein